MTVAGEQDFGLGALAEVLPGGRRWSRVRAVRSCCLRVWRDNICHGYVECCGFRVAVCCGDMTAAAPPGERCFAAAREGIAHPHAGLHKPRGHNVAGFRGLSPAME